ncbi:hypothetical protein [Marinifilum sp. D714]|uniref:hypothetical protein n=1 Tax=Marinifilum sp. D714 TaxID=2937523 RepID=UPI0027BB2C34|nr:hypothetical protein [Marinifilum sp. D714]MDQ2178401.1 hypothetical protein [Marinifilum sp. D714]
MKKYTLIIIVLVVSTIFNAFFRDVMIDIAFSAILFQFLGSLLLGYVISMFVAKYKENDWVKYWKVMYVVMVAISLLVHYLNFLPTSDTL